MKGSIENNDYEVILEDHEIEDYRFYRLHYLNYHNIGNRYGYANLEGVIDMDFIPFMFPSGMDRNDGLKVLSYLTDFIESRDDVDVASLRSVRVLDDVLKLKRFGFSRLEFIPRDEYIIDLFTVSGRIERFKESKYYSKYFNWYTPGVTKEEVEFIYKRCGMNFSDIIFLDDKNISKKKMLRR